MDAVLSELAYSSEVLEKFKQEKVIAKFFRLVYFTHNFHQINLRCSISCFHKSYLLTQQIGVSIVPLLTDQELSELGIKTVGDRAMLRKHCRESVQSK